MSLLALPIVVDWLRFCRVFLFSILILELRVDLYSHDLAKFAGKFLEDSPLILGTTE